MKGEAQKVEETPAGQTDYIPAAPLLCKGHPHFDLFMVTAHLGCFFVHFKYAFLSLLLLVCKWSIQFYKLHSTSVHNGTIF